MADALAPHIVLAKLEEKEKLRLTNRLSDIVAERDKLQRAMEDACARLQDIEGRRRQGFSSGIKGADLIALSMAEQEQLMLKAALNEQLAALRESEKEVIRQMLACENKSKVYARVQQKQDDRQVRLANRSEQQKLDDVMAHRRMRRS